MPPHRCGFFRHLHLHPACREDREDVVIAKQLVGGGLQVVEMVRIGGDAAKHAHHELEEDGPLDEATVSEVFEHVEVTDIVAFEFETGAAFGTHPAQDSLDVARRVLEDEVIGIAQEWLLPVVQPFVSLAEHRVQCKVHRPHVERTHFRPQRERRRNTVIQAHHRAAAGRQVHHSIRPGTDHGQEGTVVIDRGRRLTRQRIAGM